MQWNRKRKWGRTLENRDKRRGCKKTTKSITTIRICKYICCRQYSLCLYDDNTVLRLHVYISVICAMSMSKEVISLILGKLGMRKIRATWVDSLLGETDKRYSYEPNLNSPLTYDERPLRQVLVALDRVQFTRHKTEFLNGKMYTYIYIYTPR